MLLGRQLDSNTLKSRINHMQMPLMKNHIETNIITNNDKNIDDCN